MAVRMLAVVLVVLVVLAALAATLTACTPVPVSRVEVARVPSPDGALDAVVVETDPGATGAPGFFVHVLPRGGAPEWERHALRVYGAFTAGRYGLDLRWTGPRELQAGYGQARFADPPVPAITAPVETDDGTGTTVELRVLAGVGRRPQG